MRFTAYLVLLATLLLWSGNWVVARAVRDEIAPGIATAGRLVIVLLVLVPFVFHGLKEKIGTMERQQWKILLALGFFGGGLHLALQWLGLHYTTATSGILYLSTSPLFILLLARPLLGEAIGARQWAGIAISFLGVFLIATQGRIQTLSFNIGAGARLDGDVGRLHRVPAPAPRCARDTGVPGGGLRFWPLVCFTLGPVGIHE